MVAQSPYYIAYLFDGLVSVLVNFVSVNSTCAVLQPKLWLCQWKSQWPQWSSGCAIPFSARYQPTLLHISLCAHVHGSSAVFVPNKFIHSMEAVSLYWTVIQSTPIYVAFEFHLRTNVCWYVYVVAAYNMQLLVTVWALCILYSRGSKLRKVWLMLQLITHSDGL